jgi:hypothetical protein
MVYPPLLALMRTLRLPVVNWTDVRADVNGIVRFAERRNLVSARVPSHFRRSLRPQRRQNLPSTRKCSTTTAMWSPAHKPKLRLSVYRSTTYLVHSKVSAPPPHKKGISFLRKVAAYGTKSTRPAYHQKTEKSHHVLNIKKKFSQILTVQFTLQLPTHISLPQKNGIRTSQ